MNKNKKRNSPKKKPAKSTKNVITKSQQKNNVWKNRTIKLSLLAIVGTVSPLILNAFSSYKYSSVKLSNEYSSLKRLAQNNYDNYHEFLDDGIETGKLKFLPDDPREVSATELKSFFANDTNYNLKVGGFRGGAFNTDIAQLNRGGMMATLNLWKYIIHTEGFARTIGEYTWLRGRTPSDKAGYTWGTSTDKTMDPRELYHKLRNFDNTTGYTAIDDGVRVNFENGVYYKNNDSDKNPIKEEDTRKGMIINVDPWRPTKGTMEANVGTIEDNVLRTNSTNEDAYDLFSNAYTNTGGFVSNVFVRNEIGDPMTDRMDKVWKKWKPRIELKDHNLKLDDSQKHFYHLYDAILGNRTLFTNSEFSQFVSEDEKDFTGVIGANESTEPLTSTYSKDNFTGTAYNKNFTREEFIKWLFPSDVENASNNSQKTGGKSTGLSAPTFYADWRDSYDDEKIKLDLQKIEIEKKLVSTWTAEEKQIVDRVNQFDGVEWRNYDLKNKSTGSVFDGLNITYGYSSSVFLHEIFHNIGFSHAGESMKWFLGLRDFISDSNITGDNDQKSNNWRDSSYLKIKGKNGSDKTSLFAESTSIIHTILDRYISNRNDSWSWNSDEEKFYTPENISFYSMENDGTSRKGAVNKLDRVKLSDYNMLQRYPNDFTMEDGWYDENSPINLSIVEDAKGEVLKW